MSEINIRGRLTLRKSGIFIDKTPLSEIVGKLNNNDVLINVKAFTKQNGYSFFEIAMGDDDRFPFFGIVKTDYWNKNKQVNDEDKNMPALPKGFEPVSPSVFVYDGDKIKAEVLLRQIGFDKVHQKNS